MAVRVTDDAAAEALVLALQRRGYHVEAAIEQEATNRLVAGISHLIALKILARDDRTRPQDRVDLVGLLGRADARVIAAVREALALITQRGFHRGRDLAADLEALLLERDR